MTRRRDSRRRRRGAAIADFSLSFLDAICCGFGALVLLLVLAKIGEPRALEGATVDLEARVLALQEELYEIRGENTILNRQLRTKESQISEEESRIARLRGDLSRISGEFAATEQLSEIQDLLEGRLLAAQQELSEEMKRLLGRSHRRADDDLTIGGVPVDSEYIIFVIDTSGSMFQYAWPAVQRKMREILDIYPNVKGVQILNDMGRYMFSGYVGKWIPDTPGRRQIILQRLASWNVFSNSSPVEGVTRAVQTFASSDRKVSIYVFGDEFSGDSIQAVLEDIRKTNLYDGNRRDKNGEPRVRIHAVGFPVIFQVPGISEQTGIRFATLMRALCYENGGTFVGLNSIE